MRSKEKGTEVAVLVAKSVKGDERAWEKLVREFQNLVWAIPLRMGLSKELSGDVFQESFIQLYKNLDRIGAPEAIPKWLAVTTARNAVRAKRLNAELHVSTDLEGGTLDELVASEEASAETIAISSLFADDLRRLVRNMTGKCGRLLWALFFEEHEGYEAVAQAVRMPVGAIGPTRARCLEKLRQTLDERGLLEK